MTAVTNLRVLADWDRTAAFDHPLSDITDRVRTAAWSWGFSSPDGRVAPPASGTVILDNSDGAFLVGKSGATFAGLLTRDVLIRFQHADGNVFMTLRAAGIRIAPDTYGQRIVVLALTDWHAELMSALYDPILATNQTTGAAIETAWRAGLVGMPYTGSWWVMGASLMGIDTRPFDPSESFEGDTGQTTLDYVGDNIDRGEGVSLLAFVEEMCTAEMAGRFLYTPSGKYVFQDRHAVAREVALGTVHTVRAEWLRNEGEYASGAALLNTVEITLYPRKVGAAGTELARNTNPIRLAAYEARNISLRYRDPDAPDATCTASTLVSPVANTDYAANSAQDGSGTNLTASLTVSVVNKTSAADVMLVNNGATDLYVTLVRVRGTPLSALQPVKVRGVDAASVRNFGRQSAQMTIAGVDDTELVQRYADYVVRRRAEPLTAYQAITFDFPEDATDPLWDIAFAGPLMVLRVLDTEIEDAAITRVQVVTGVAHSVSWETGWQVRYTLEDAVQNAGWVMGDPVLGVMGVTTIPIF